MIIDRIWKEQPGKYFCISTKSRGGKWEDHFFKRNQFNTLNSFIADHRDKDLYFCPHGFSKPRRLKECAEIPKLLWADLDEVDPRKVTFMPTVAWESSPGRWAALWVLDTFMNESLNRRLTYSMGADRGGWDMTQVLRVPGTHNFKYESTPKVRLLWSDGPTHHVETIEAGLPKERKTSTDRSTANRIYKKYEKHLSPFIRRELFKGKPKPGKRSEVLWKIVHELVEAGMSQDECFEVLRESPWNKFSGRRDGDEQLKREISKVLEHHLSVGNVVIVDDAHQPGDEEEYEGPPDDEEDEEDYRYLSRSMEDVEEENMNWIWYPYLARGELTILEGDPGLGKSYLAQMISIAIVDGERLPSVKKLPAIQGKVAYFDIENSSGTVTKKRLIANGCVNLREFFQEEEPFSIDDPDAIDHIYAAIDKLKPTLVVFDTLNTYMGKTDTHNASQSQQTFKIFREIAKRFNCSVLVLRHLTKSTKERAIYRGQGSIAFTGLARVVMTVGTHPDEPDVRAVAVTKINVTRPPKALTFTIKALPDTLREQDRSEFIWGDFVDFDSDDIVSADPVRKQRTEERTDDAKRFLMEVLDDGKMEFNALRRAAEARSISLKTLYKAGEEINIKKKSLGFGAKKRGYWELPKKK